MRKLFIFLFITFACFTRGQQTIVYTQYMFNTAGMNPAASGPDINREYYYSFGLNRQWLDFDNSPKVNFINFSYTIRPHRSYSYWQNVGAYVDNEQSGLFSNTGGYLTYSLHLLLRKKNVLSFGIFAGARMYSRSIGIFDPNDPVVSKSRTSVIVYPDIIPGVRFRDRRSYWGVSARQITINKLQDFRKRSLGSPSKLQPHIYLEYGRFIPLTEYLLAVPSAALNVPVIAPPVADASIMVYYSNRVGAGVSVRNLSFVSGILQVRFLKNMTAGFAYSYPLNLTRYGSANSFELMVGVVPMGMEMKSDGRHSVARCPTLNY